MSVRSGSEWNVKRMISLERELKVRLVLDHSVIISLVKSVHLKANIAHIVL
jgi:hypothetical protein